MGIYLLNVVEESRIIGEVSMVINAPFIDLIPKSSYSYSFNDSPPSSLCNMATKLLLLSNS